MKHKQLKEIKILEPVTLFSPHIDGLWEAHILTALFDEDNVVGKLITYYN